MLASHLFFLGPTFAVVAAGSNNTNAKTTISTDSSLNYQVTCYDDLYDRRRARKVHCIRAINLLPESVTPSIFHTGGLDDSYRLPRTIQYESCRVILSLQNGPDLSSWHWISYAAAQVVFSCARTYAFSPRTGGYTYVGDHGVIKISVERDPMWLSDDYMELNITSPMKSPQ